MPKGYECPAADAAFIPERRCGPDRRKGGFSLTRSFSGGRRRRLRRRSDLCRIHLLDHYRPKILYLVLVVLGLSLTDAYLTLWLLEEGASELNPVMAYFLGFGPLVFLAAKHLITSASVVIIVLLYYTRIGKSGFKLGRLLYFFAACFGAVVVWELTLLNLVR